ncbi:FmdB-like transcriptional regulator [Salmonella phage STML-198]|uniref:Putative regulatory protein FmdB zinc ribbon domain-containing protein n=1 Tax=Salmonella phage STML-198 TaxID=1204531 RepID=K4I5X6_9CAUD|nr:FmdB-like transcriptional regulator [Salmonella phage STML-198]AFU63960.1 hypothetical protein [Salmonella phage STML-198]
MPIYDYMCEACDEKIEKMRKVSERDEPIECSFLNCEGKMFRETAAPAVHYNGYKNRDYS